MYFAPLLRVPVGRLQPLCDPGVQHVMLEGRRGRLLFHREEVPVAAVNSSPTSLWPKIEAITEHGCRQRQLARSTYAAGRERGRLCSGGQRRSPLAPPVQPQVGSSVPSACAGREVSPPVQERRAPSLAGERVAAPGASAGRSAAGRRPVRRSESLTRERERCRARSRCLRTGDAGTRPREVPKRLRRGRCGPPPAADYGDQHHPRIRPRRPRRSGSRPTT